ncbi:MAG TPA: CxxxxCH/CxxCH domain-containing protein [Geobacter sp.]|nr:CxxxxCH/CxxCH domain-containing protein [Geobacter sp.]
MQRNLRRISSWSAGAVSLALALAFAAVAQGAPQYAMDCTSCHTMPPTDSKPPKATKKDPFTGAVPGNHETHAGGDAASCVSCHGTAVTSNSHRNKSIELQPGIGYSLGFANQTSVPLNPLGTCATVSCHSDGKGNYRATPAWGSTAPADCTTCHDAAPASGNHNVPGSKHATYYGTGVNSCSVCHSDHAGEPKPFAHATSSRGIQVRFASGGGFDGSQCSALYCHSNGQGTPVSVFWTGSLPADCSGCHGNAATGGLSGKHAKHVNNGKLGSSYGCVECHADTVDGDFNVSQTANHVNVMINYSGTKAGRLAGTCSTVYCHSDGKGNMKTLAADSWANGSFPDCRGCHGSDASPDFTASAAGEPNYVSGPAGSDTANSHKKHVGTAGASTCVDCHSTTTTNGTTLIGATHTNRVIDVAPSVAKPFDVNGKTCSNISCHKGGTIIASAPAAIWGGTLDCAGCHGDAATLNTLAHRAHLTTGSRCDSCHSATATDNTTLQAGGPHIDYGVQVAGSSITSFDASKNCATTCHMSATPNWAVPSSGACGTCHAALANDPGPLKLITSVAHDAHYTAAYGPLLSTTSAASCSECHTPSNALSHVNGGIDLKAGASSNGLCLDCHKQTTNWASPSVTCQSCHTGALSVIGGVTAADKTLDATKGHGAFAVGCSACHDGSGAHISGVLGDNNRILGGLAGDAQCNSCHNDSGKVTARSLNMQVHDGMANSCGACHDAHGTQNSFMVATTMAGRKVNYNGANFVNAQGTGVCQACHTSTGYYLAGGGLEATHPTEGCLTSNCHPHNTAGGVAFAPSGDCDSCHGYPPMPRNVAGLTFGTMGNWTSAKFESYSGGGGAHAVAAHVTKDAKASDGWTNCTMCHVEGAAAHAKALPVKNHIENVSVKLDQQYRLSDEAFMAYTGAKLVTGANQTGSCFNVNCHFRQTQPWSTEK